LKMPRLITSSPKIWLNTIGSCMANDLLHSFPIVVCVKHSFPICCMCETFVICLILPLEHLLTFPKNIIVIIMTIIVWCKTFILCEWCVGSNMQFVKKPCFEGLKTRTSYSVLRGGDTGSASSSEFSAGEKWIQGPLLAF
jgi:hypothetical protein